MKASIKKALPVWLIWVLPCPRPALQNNRPGSGSSLGRQGGTAGRSWRTLWPARTSHLEGGEGTAEQQQMNINASF